MNKSLVILLILLITYVTIKLCQYFLREKYMTPEEQSWVGRERGILHGSGEIGGVVWTNGNYDIAKEAPGLSWIL